MSIPGEYTSFLAPISSSKLYNEVRACREKDRDPEVKKPLSSGGLLSLVLYFSVLAPEDGEVEEELGMWESGRTESLFSFFSMFLRLELLSLRK